MTVQVKVSPPGVPWERELGQVLHITTMEVMVVDEQGEALVLTREDMGPPNASQLAGIGRRKRRLMRALLKEALDRLEDSAPAVGIAAFAVERGGITYPLPGDLA